VNSAWWITLADAVTIGLRTEIQLVEDAQLCMAMSDATTILAASRNPLAAMFLNPASGSGMQPASGTFLAVS